MGWFPRRRAYGNCEYTSAEATRAEAGFETMEAYIWQRHNTVAQYIATRSLLDLCNATERMQGARVVIWWWEQAGIDMTGERETTETAAEVDEYGMEEYR